MRAQTIHPWRLLQLADSAFPTGGFAHSGGLEAMVQLGEVAREADVEAFASESLWQAGRMALPFVTAAYHVPATIDALDARAEALLVNHVANRASRTQGRAFVGTACRVFDTAWLRDIDARVHARQLHAHVAPLFGATSASLGLGLPDCQALFLHLTLRGVMSAAVRLGAAGPIEAQRMQCRLGMTLDAVLSACAATPIDGVAQSSPLIDLFSAAHDRLYSRLFQS